MDYDLALLEAKKNIVIKTHKRNKICWIVGMIIGFLSLIGCGISFITGKVGAVFWVSFLMLVIAFTLSVTALISDAMKYDKNLAACNAEIEKYNSVF